MTIDNFLSAFFPDEQEAIRLRFFPAKGVDGDAVKYGVTRTTLHSDAETQAYVKRMNHSLGCYFVVNAGGDSDKDITRYNAWFVECDDRSIAEQHAALDDGPLQPSIRVETKKSVHAYWLIKDFDCQESEWRDMQARLIAHYEADRKNKNLSRVMRIPFLNHIRLEDGELLKHRITMPFFAPEIVYTLAQMRAVFAPAHEEQAAIHYATGSYPNWEILGAEARRRILNMPGVQIHGEWAKCRGICHDGKSGTGLAVNVASGAFFCQADCDTAHVLRSLGLPEKPDQGVYIKRESKPAMPQEPAPEVEADSTEGIYTVDDLSERIDELYEKGLTPGESPGWQTFSQYYTVKKGQFTVITGVPGSGKTQVLDNILVNLASRQKWKFAVCSLENHPLEQHAATLLEIFSGEPFTGINRMSTNTRDIAKEWLNEHFVFLLPKEDDCTITGLIDLAEKARQKRSIDGLVIDPWNEFEHRRPAMMTETQYTSDVLSRIRRFGRTNDIHVWLVAHPTKLQKDKDGHYPVQTLYDISGSAHFRNKCDMGLVAWRDANDPASHTVVYIQKVRFRWCGKLGSVELRFNPVTGQYDEVGAASEYKRPAYAQSNGNGRGYYESYD